MKRAVIFAHYDIENLIRDYVVYYLKSLKEISDEIIFVSCSRIKNHSALDGIADCIIDEPHNEYDFGSYKRGFFHIQNRLDEFDEIVFANDSCYGPIYPLSEVFGEMDKKSCDFWGITKNNFGYAKTQKRFFVKRPHIQSYFMVIKKQIFTEDFFNEFINSIIAQETKKQIISNYEIGLTELLVKNGFKYEVFVNAYSYVNNISILKWRQIVKKYHMPFIKKSLLNLKNTDATTIEGYENLLKDYPKQLITLPRKVNKKTPYFIKRFIFDTLSNFPFALRKLFTMAINNLFSFLKD